MVYTPSKKIRELKRRKIIKKLFFYYFSPLFFLTVFLFVIYSWSVFSIQNINIIASDKINKNEINNIIIENISGKYFFILRKDNSIFYPQKKIKTEILNSDTRIKFVKIFTNNWGRDLEFKIVERKEKYLYCQKKLKQGFDISVICNFMGEDGVIFGSPIVNLENKKNFTKFFVKEISKKEIFEINLLIEKLEKISLKVERVYKDEYLKFILKGGTKILLKNNFSSQDISEKLEVIFSHQDFEISLNKNSERTFKNKIYYLNLKFGEKIYYCDNEKCAGNY